MAFDYFDIHSHLNFPDFDADRDAVISDLQAEHIATITVGIDERTSREAAALAAKHEHLFATVGVHPTDVLDGFDDKAFEELIRQPKIVAVGECGLDYYRTEDHESGIKEKQKHLFEKHLDFALLHDLPLMVHCRPSRNSMDAYGDVSEILDSYFRIHGTKLRGNVHFFVGTVGVARRFLDIGFTVSFDGPITFARDYDEVIRSTPKDMLMAETDAPFAAPAPFRGKRSEPRHVREVVRALASIRGEAVEDVRRATVANAERVFNIARTVAR